MQVHNPVFSTGSASNCGSGFAYFAFSQRLLRMATMGVGVFGMSGSEERRAKRELGVWTWGPRLGMQGGSQREGLARQRGACIRWRHHVRVHDYGLSVVFFFFPLVRIFLCSVTVTAAVFFMGTTERKNHYAR